MEVRCKSLECGATFERSPEDTGRIVHCPECGEPTEVPASDESGNIGRRIGDYEIVRRIAKGGMGEVYEAIQTSLDRRVAVKILSPHLASNEAFISRFKREAKAAASLNHPHIVQVHDFGQEGQEYYLVMEFVEGEDLSRHVTHHGGLSVSDTLRITLQTAEALSEARQKGIIHRDIKPANLLLNARGDVKVSDMGLAKNLTEDLELTATGVGIGSPHFIAPEQADDAKTVDHRADIYSLGISMMYLLTGKKPFEGSSAFSVVLAHANKPLPSGQDLGTQLPDNVEKLIQRMTAKDPKDRYPDYTSLISDLHRVAEGMDPTFSPEAGTTETILLPHGNLRQPGQSPSAMPDKNSRSSRMRGPLATLAAVMLLGLGAWALFLRPGSGEPPSAPRAEGPAAEFPAEPLSQPRSVDDVPFTPEELRTLEEMLGPMPPMRPAQRRAALGNTPPVLPIDLPDLPTPRALTNSEPGLMQQELEAYAKSNPEAFRDLLAGYDQLLSQPLGPSISKALSMERTELVEEQLRVAKEELRRRMARVNSLLDAIQPLAAAEHLNSFPDQLRTEEVDELIRKTAREIPGPNQDSRRPFPGLRGGLRPGLAPQLRNGAP